MKITNRTVAANTCLKWVHAEALPTVYPDSGPYRLSPSLELPETYLLTRTHCAGVYFFTLKVDQDTFQSACRKTAVVERFGYKSRQGSYEDFPPKAIHLWRDPFDNIVSRWRHAKRYVWIPSFRWYCSIMDRLVWPLRGSKVPCKSEFIRYVQWHNHAMSLEDKVEVLHVKYEAFEDDDTMGNVLDFLELPKRQEGIAFVPNKSYIGYFTPEQEQKVIAILEEMATPEVRPILQEYLG